MLGNVILPRRLNSIVQYFIFFRISERVIMLSDTDVACVAILLSPFLKQKSNRPSPNNIQN
jgi:hypothetical protein